MTAEPNREPRSDPAFWSIAIAAGVTAGLATGVLEAAATVIAKLGFNGAKGFGLQFWWMAPVAEATVFGLGAVGLAVVLAVVPVRHRWGVLAGALAAGAALSIALFANRLDRYACVLLALGLGFRAWQVLRHRPAPDPRRLWRWNAALAGVVLLGVPVGLVLRPGGGPSGPAGDRPNVLLVVLDTEGADALHLYGYPRRTSDALDALAPSAVVFDQAYATAPWTLPSHGSLFTGRHAHELSGGFRTPLDDAYPTIAEVLRGAGYRTAGFVANLRFVNREFGLARGFERYDDYPTVPSEVLMASSVVRSAVLRPRVRRLLGYHDIIARKRAPAVTASFLSWLKEKDDRPWFAFLNYWDAHEPYLPEAGDVTRFAAAGPSDYRRADYRLRETILHQGSRKRMAPGVRQAERDRYDASVAAVDRSLALLFDELARRGELDRTIVVVTADHGEEHGERGEFTHAHSVNPAVLRIPLVIRYPAKVPSGRRIDSTVSLRSVPATVLELAGVPAPATMAPGLDRYWLDSTTPAEPAVSSLFHEGDSSFSVVLGAMQYQVFKGVERLFPLAAEGADLVNLVRDPHHAATVARGRELLDSLLGAVP